MFRPHPQILRPPLVLSTPEYIEIIEDWFSEQNIHKPPDTLDVGMGANLHLSTCKKSEE